MSLLKRHVFIAAGVGLYLLNASHPLLSVAESIAANTQEPHPTLAVNQDASDLGGNSAIQFYMMEEPDKATASIDDSAFEPLLLPGITTPAAEAQSYLIERPNGEDIAIKVMRENASGFASVFINEHEVIKFRSGYDVLDAYDRAQLVAQRLYSYLNNEIGTDSLNSISIRPEAEKGHYVVMMGGDVLATVDPEAALANGNSEKAQAIVWTNQIRHALSMPVYKEPIAAVTAVISSPGVSKKYKLPLSTAYFKGTGKLQSGQASWYGPGFHGRRAADGSRFDMNMMTVAHRYLPFGTVLKVKNNRTGKSCLVQVTDRGPYAHGRILDLSKGAAGAIGMLGSGTAPVTIEVLAPGPKPSSVQTADSRLIGTGDEPHITKN